jgi:hypothetical protein
MTIWIGKYEFDGPYHKVEDLEEKPGLYVVLHYKNQEYEFMHVAQAENVREGIEALPSAEHPKGKVLLATLYTSNCGIRERRSMVQDIQNEFPENSD